MEAMLCGESGSICSAARTGLEAFSQKSDDRPSMSETKRAARPLSPHLQIYRPMLTMMMSIMHRITGSALYVGVLLLIWWLVSAARSDAAFDTAQAFFGHWFGRLILF